MTDAYHALGNVNESQEAVSKSVYPQKKTVSTCRTKVKRAAETDGGKFQDTASICSPWSGFAHVCLKLNVMSCCETL
jgi:hypothetical protein